MRAFTAILFCALITLFLFACVDGHSHSHDHGHAHEHAHEHGHHHGHHGHHHGHGHHHDHGHQHHHDEDVEEEPMFNRYSREMNAQEEPEIPKPTEKPHTKTKMPLPPKPVRSTATIWLEAITSTILISAAPFFILFFIPLTGNTEEQKPLLKVLLAFASGGLLGDAFLHLIPHAISPHSHLEEDHSEHSHDHSHGGHGHDHSRDMAVGFWVLGGMITFLIVEKFVRYVKGGHGHSHGHSHEPAAAPASKKGEENDKVANGEKKEISVRKRKTSDSDKETTDDSKTKALEKTAEEPKEPEEIKVAGYLNLAADFTHNFTDGLAIGASFLVSRNLGVITTLTILLHEVPHEIGDFAILVQSGCNKRKAMYLQLSTATGALAGTFCGLLAHNIGTSATLWILPFTAGGFIYIATVSVIPELLEETKIGQSIKEILSLLFGVFMMVIIAQLE